jgi:hypothetical protein
MSENPPREAIPSESSTGSPGEPKMMNRMARDEWGQLIVKRIYDKTEPFTSPEDLIRRILDNPPQMFDYIHELEEDRGAVRDLMELLYSEKMMDRLLNLEKKNKKAVQRLVYQGVVVVVLVAVVGVLWTIVTGAKFWKFLQRNECAAYIGEWKLSRV